MVLEHQLPIASKKRFNSATVFGGPICLASRENPRMSIFSSVIVFTSSIMGLPPSNPWMILSTTSLGTKVETGGDVAFMLGGRHRFLVEPRILKGDADRGRNGLQQVAVVMSKCPDTLFNTSITPITRPWEIMGTHKADRVRNPEASSMTEKTAWTFRCR